MNKDIFKSRSMGNIDIPQPHLGETLFEVLMEGFVFGKALVWAKDYDDAMRKAEQREDFAFVKSEDEPSQWDPVCNEGESPLLYPDHEYIEYDPQDQVIYIPQHAEMDPTHPDCEYGFVTKDLGEDCFVRYWNMTKYREGKYELRTKANSERTPKDCLYPYKSVFTALVRINWRKYVEPEGGQK
jgi:hypothetical protein